MDKRYIYTGLEVVLCFLIVVTMYLFVYDVYIYIVGYKPFFTFTMGQYALISAVKFLSFAIVSGILLYLLRNKVQTDYFSVCTIFREYSKEHKIIVIPTLLILFGTLFLRGIYQNSDKFVYLINYTEPGESSLLSNERYTKLTLGENDKYTGWAKLEGTDKKTILYYGGNAECAAELFKLYDDNGWDELENYNFIYIDYPGYGTSKGKPSEEGLYDMSLVVYDEVIELYNLDEEELIVMGYSLGTGIATYVSVNRDFDKLILLAPYASMFDMFNEYVPMFYGPMTSLLSNEFPTIERIANANEEKLIIASTGDKVIDYEISASVFEASSNSRFMGVDTLGHNEILGDEDVQAEIACFIDGTCTD